MDDSAGATALWVSQEDVSNFFYNNSGAIERKFQQASLLAALSSGALLLLVLCHLVVSVR